MLHQTHHMYVARLFSYLSTTGVVPIWWKFWYWWKAVQRLRRKCQNRGIAKCQQGTWFNLDSASAQKISWTYLWNLEPARLKFLIHSVCNMPPKLLRLHCCKAADTSAYPLCSPLHWNPAKRASEQHHFCQGREGFPGSTQPGTDRPKETVKASTIHCKNIFQTRPALSIKFNKNWFWNSQVPGKIGRSSWQPTLSCLRNQ